jgi:hypothetical protein
VLKRDGGLVVVEEEISSPLPFCPTSSSGSEASSKYRDVAMQRIHDSY